MPLSQAPGLSLPRTLLIIYNGDNPSLPEGTLWCYACSEEVVKEKANVLAHVKDRKHKENVAFTFYRPKFCVKNKLAIAQRRRPKCARGYTLLQDLRSPYAPTWTLVSTVPSLGAWPVGSATTSL